MVSNKKTSIRTSNASKFSNLSIKALYNSCHKIVNHQPQRSSRWLVYNTMATIVHFYRFYNLMRIIID